MKRLMNYWPLLVALAVLCLEVAILVVLSMDHNEGHLVYTLDDTYIQLAMGRNLGLHGVWGMTPHGFTSSSSSPAWTLLMGAIFAAGEMWEGTPLVLNLLFAMVTLALAAAILRRHQVRPRLRLVVLLATVLLVPLPTVIFCGMEHLLHSFLTLGTVYLAAGVATRETGVNRWEAVGLLILPALVVMARFEGIFVVFIITIALLLGRRFLLGLAVGFVGAVPVLVYGLVSWRAGWFLLPNSVMLKGNTPRLGTLAGWVSFFDWLSPAKLPRISHVLVLMIGVGVLTALAWRRRGPRHRSVVMGVLFVAATLLHLQFAKVGWFFRYEAYLLIWGFIAATLLGIDLWPTAMPFSGTGGGWWRRVTLVAGLVVLALPLLGRGVIANARIVPATGNIYRQQVQMGRFLARYYQGQVVAANDIGAINYLADIRCLDLFGLSSIQVAQLRSGGRFATRHMARLANKQGAIIGVLYPDKYKRFGGLPRRWISVAKWTIPNNVICGNKTVTWYAIRAEAAPVLKERLDAFASSLPPDVRYTDIFGKTDHSPGPP